MWKCVWGCVSLCPSKKWPYRVITYMVKFLQPKPISRTASNLKTSVSVWHSRRQYVAEWKSPLPLPPFLPPLGQGGSQGFSRFLTLLNLGEKTFSRHSLEFNMRIFLSQILRLTPWPLAPWIWLFLDPGWLRISVDWFLFLSFFPYWPLSNNLLKATKKEFWKLLIVRQSRVQMIWKKHLGKWLRQNYTSWSILTLGSIQFVQKTQNIPTMSEFMSFFPTFRYGLSQSGDNTQKTILDDHDLELSTRRSDFSWMESFSPEYASAIGRISYTSSQHRSEIHCLYTLYPWGWPKDCCLETIC